jgi:hypothetical protein
MLLNAPQVLFENGRLFHKSVNLLPVRETNEFTLAPNLRQLLDEFGSSGNRVGDLRPISVEVGQHAGQNLEAEIFFVS